MTVREIEMRVFVFRDMMGVKRIRDIFKSFWETPRTYCNVFQTYISHKTLPMVTEASGWHVTKRLQYLKYSKFELRIEFCF